MIERPADQLVSRPKDMAGCHVVGRGVLSANARIPARRTVRPYITDQAVGSFDFRQYRRRSRSGKHRQLRAIVANRTGLAERAGNAFDFGGAHRSVAGAGAANHSRAMREPWKNGSRADPILAGQVAKMTFATRYSLFAIRQQAGAAS